MTENVIAEIRSIKPNFIIHILKSKIHSSTTNFPLEGVRIRVIGENHYYFTNSEGVFEIPVTHKSGELEFCLHGYDCKTVSFHEGEVDYGRTTIHMVPRIEGVPKLFIGDTIPDVLWDLPLTVYNHPEGRKVVSLREYEEKKLIVLDFWAVYCTPCIRTIDKWESIISNYSNDIAYLTVHVELQTYVPSFIDQKKWVSPVIIGDSHLKLNSAFFNRHQLGMVVFIYNNRFHSVPLNYGYDEYILRDLLDGKSVVIQSNLSATHKNIQEGGRK